MPLDSNREGQDRYPGIPSSGLLIGETGWQRALLQQAEGGVWVDRGIVLPSRGTDGEAVAGFFLPMSVFNLDPSAAGLFRVWLLDFELPPANLAIVGPPFRFEAGRLVPLNLLASPGRVFDLEASGQLTSWGAPRRRIRFASSRQLESSGKLCIALLKDSSCRRS